MQVFWVNTLTRENFEKGFGSHTPMLTGNMKNVRYYAYFPQAFARLKDQVSKVSLDDA